MTTTAKKSKNSLVILYQIVELDTQIVWQGTYDEDKAYAKRDELRKKYQRTFFIRETKVRK